MATAVVGVDMPVRVSLGVDTGSVPVSLGTVYTANGSRSKNKGCETVDRGESRSQKWRVDDVHAPIHPPIHPSMPTGQSVANPTATCPRCRALESAARPLWAVGCGLWAVGVHCAVGRALASHTTRQDLRLLSDETSNIFPIPSRRCRLSNVRPSQADSKHLATKCQKTQTRDREYQHSRRSALAPSALRTAEPLP